MESGDLTKTIFGTDSSLSIERPNPAVEIFHEVVTEIYNKEDIELKTDLNDHQIIAFARCKVFGAEYRIPLFANVVKELSLFSVSRGRKGRKEFADIAKATSGMGAEEEARSIPDRMLGRR